MYAQVRTKNPTAAPLRRSIVIPVRAVVRLGSRSATEMCFPGRRNVIEVNTVESIENSRDKLKMKNCFSRYDVSQAEFWTLAPDRLFQNGNTNREIEIREMQFPLVGKQVIGFKGHGMQLIENIDQLRTFLHNHNQSYFIEKFYNYAREYRLHVARDVGVFMSWRKLRKADATERWFFNSSNCNWVSPDHELFDRPRCWDDMCTHAVNALTATGLDIGAVDIRVQSNETRAPKFIVCEINSAPALGEIGIEKYRETITTLINNKHGKDNM